MRKKSPDSLRIANLKTSTHSLTANYSDSHIQEVTDQLAHAPEHFSFRSQVNEADQSWSI